MMTADDLRKIARRHIEDGLPAKQCPTREEVAHVCAQMYADRGDLLSLVRRIAETDPMCEGGGCHFCGYYNHEPDCLWLISQGVRP